MPLDHARRAVDHRTVTGDRVRDRYSGQGCLSRKTPSGGGSKIVFRLRIIFRLSTNFLPCKNRLYCKKGQKKFGRLRRPKKKRCNFFRAAFGGPEKEVYFFFPRNAKKKNRAFCPKICGVQKLPQKVFFWLKKCDFF